MKKCLKCNKDFDQEYKLCPFCGNTLVDKEQHDEKEKIMNRTREFYSKQEFKDFLKEYNRFNNNLCDYNDGGKKLPIKYVYIICYGSLVKKYDSNSFNFGMRYAPSINEETAIKLCESYIAMHFAYIYHDLYLADYHATTNDFLFDDGAALLKFNKVSGLFDKDDQVLTYQKKYKEDAIKAIKEETAKLKNYSDIMEHKISYSTLKSNLETGIYEVKRDLDNFRYTSYSYNPNRVSNPTELKSYEDQIREEVNVVLNGGTYCDYKFEKGLIARVNESFKYNDEPKETLIKYFSMMNDIEILKAQIDRGIQFKKHKKDDYPYFKRNGWHQCFSRLNEPRMIGSLSSFSEFPG